MAGITLAQAEAQLQAWLDASLAVARNQSYSIGGRTLTRANAAEIQSAIDRWQSMVIRLQTAGGGMRVRYGVPE